MAEAAVYRLASQVSPSPPPFITHPLPPRPPAPSCSQWSWPINLPAQFFGIFPTGVLRSNADDTPWAGEIEQKVFESSVGIGPYIECAFFHKRTRTLLVTDAVISVPANPPEVEADGAGRSGAEWGGAGRSGASTCGQGYMHAAVLDTSISADTLPLLQLVAPESLLEAASRNFFIDVLAGPSGLAAQPVDGVPLAPTELTPAARTLGWRRMAMQILYIVPGDLRDPKR